MAYYTALINAWNGAQQPPSGVTGTALTAGMTTTQKLAAVNAWTTAGAAVPMIISTYQIYNLIVGTEFAALSAANQQLLRDILSMGTVDASPGTQIRARIVALFPNGTQTFTALAALAKTYDTPQVSWCQANGYPVLGVADCTNAGLS